MKSILLCKILFEIIIFFYIISSGKYAGDSIDIAVTLSENYLLLVLIITIFPYCIIYLFIIKCKIKNQLEINLYFITKIIIIIGLLSIIFTLLYDSGIVSKGIYNAPFLLTPFIIITNRLDIQTCGLLMIYGLSNSFSKKILWIEMLLSSLFRSSFQAVGIFIFYITSKLKIFPIISIIGLLTYLEISYGIVSIFINIMYGYRDGLRGVIYQGNATGMDLIVGKILARMSNYSNLAMIFENYQEFIVVSEKISYYDYLIDALNYVWGSFYNIQLPTIQYYYTEILDPNAGYNYGMSPSLPGILIMSYLKSTYLLIINIIIYFIAVYGICKISMKIIGERGKDFTYLIIVTDLSGLASYLYKTFFTLLILYALIYIFNYFKNHIYKIKIY
jgi:hypothetical protein